MTKIINIKVYKFLFVFNFFILFNNCYSQGIYEDVNNSNIYSLLDELANTHIISLNSAIKPLNKYQIYEKLIEANKSKKINNKRLKNDINFYLKKYEEYSHKQFIKNKLYINKSSLNIIYNDNFSKILTKPIWGINKIYNKNGGNYHLYGGLETDILLNKNWHLYASLRDNTMDEANSGPEMFTNVRGGNYKYGMQNDFSEMKGGITYIFKNGSVGLIKDHIEWGVNYFGSNILSGRTPSFTTLKLNLFLNKFIELNYIHGWLVSEDIDSSLTYTTNTNIERHTFREKFISANFFSFMFTKKTFFSFGNSIIYSDLNGIHPSYLIPLLFYKSVDHTINNDIPNQNSQLFINLSSREIKNTHLYFSLFVDEFKKERLFDKNENNFLSLKVGLVLSNWPVNNFSNFLEITQNNPMTFQHTIEGISFESNQYNLGHYMRDNSRVINYKINYKLNYRINIEFKYLYEVHGEDKEYSFNNEYDPTAIPILQNKTWDNTTFSLKINHVLKDNIYLSLEYRKSDIRGYESEEFSEEYYLDKFSPKYLHGKTNNFLACINIGF